jgi:hypothetical protein
MKNAFFWDVTPFRSCKNRRFGGTYRLRHQCDYVYLRSVLRLLVAANVPSLPIIVTLMMEVVVPQKHQFLQKQHGVTFHKTAFYK